MTPAVDVFAFSYDEAAKKVAGDDIIERGSIHKLAEGLGPKRAVPAVLPTMAFHFQPSVQCRLRCWRSWE